ncbi:hypothetical protein CR513_23738, partial [Mucuna pruriens]
MVVLRGLDENSKMKGGKSSGLLLKRLRVSMWVGKSFTLLSGALLVSLKIQVNWALERLRVSLLWNPYGFLELSWKEDIDEDDPSSSQGPSRLENNILLRALECPGMTIKDQSVNSKVIAEEKFKHCSAAYQSLCDKLAINLCVHWSSEV